VSHYQFPERLINSHLVKNTWDTSYNVYKTVKNSNRWFDWGLGMVESNLGYGYQYLTPKVEPIIKSAVSMATPYLAKADPLLVKADQIGCKSLETTEKIVDQLASTACGACSKTVDTAKDTTVKTLQTVQSATLLAERTFKPVLMPVDHYLKDSVFSIPMDMALDGAEKVLDRMVIPEKQQEQQKKRKTKKNKNAKPGKEEEPEKSAEDSDEGPIFRAMRITNTLQQQLITRIQASAPKKAE
jgi:hypothetical protein